MNLSSMERNIGLFIGGGGGGGAGDYRLSDVFAMLATEERKHAGAEQNTTCVANAPLAAAALR